MPCLLILSLSLGLPVQITFAPLPSVMIIRPVAVPMMPVAPMPAVINPIETRKVCV